MGAVASAAVVGGVAGSAWLAIAPAALALSILVIGGVRRQRHQVVPPTSISAPFELDPLTGVAAPAYLEARLAELASMQTRYEQPYALVLVDIEGFAKLNEAYGREAGDRVLKSVGNALSSAVRDVDVVARTGADEFSIALPMQTAATAFQMGTRLAGSLQVPSPDGQMLQFAIAVAEAGGGENPGALRNRVAALVPRAKVSPGRVAAAPAPMVRRRRFFERPQPEARPGADVVQQNLTDEPR